MTDVLENTAMATSGGKTKKAEAVLYPPRLRPTKLDTIKNVRTELGRLYRDAREGRIATADATRLAFILGEIRKAIVDADIEARLTALESDHANY